MCGIFGYIGKGETLEALINGLDRLEYRGYDSCGIAGIKEITNCGFFVKKQTGKIQGLKENLKTSLKDRFSLAVLHTRWATHGSPTQFNAHPHLDCGEEFAVVHNGIIENYLGLKEKLIKEGHCFKSDTDTEVIVHLIEDFYKDSLLDAVHKTIDRLKGSFAFGVISKREPEVLIGVRKGSPLIVGMHKNGGFIASDIPAMLPFTKSVIYLKDEELAVLRKQGVNFFHFNGKALFPRVEKVRLKTDAAEKKEFPHFMLKEIFQQPAVLKKLFSLYLKQEKICFPCLNITAKQLKNTGRIFITACGTAYHAGYVAKYFLEKYCNVSVEIETSSEFRYRKLNFKKSDLVIAISQSGETADTLAAVKEAKKYGVKVLGICNVSESSLVRESHGFIYTLAGPEIGVASTKAYTAQLASLFLLVIYLGRIKNTLSEKAAREFLKEFKKIPLLQKEILKKSDEIKTIAKKFSQLGCFLFLGRGINYPSALEGALKLKEISYIPAEGYPAGEMKHGPIALIDEYRAVVCIAPQDDLYEKMVSNMQETKARKGKILGILNHADKEAALLADEIIYIPRLKNQELSPFLVAVCQQLLAYFVAVNLGCEIDQPRNLAKSVTVE